MDDLSVTVVDSLSELQGIADSWRALEDKCEHTSIFSSYDYVITAWEYARETDDKLFVLLLKEHEELIAIAPLAISRRRYMGLNARVIRFIAEFEGDKPTLVSQNERLAWKRIMAFLEKEYREWDVLSLMEQTENSDYLLRYFEQSGNYYETDIDSKSYSISLSMDWDSYLASLTGKVRTNWRRACKKLSQQHPDFYVESVTSSEDIVKALPRFIRLEQMGWKKDARIGVGKSDKHVMFYQQLLKRLSEHGQAALYFLKVADEDIAANMIYLYKGKVYGRQTTYHPDYASYSPGIILMSDITRRHSGAQYHEFDLQGMAPGNPKSLHTRQWSTSEQDTRRLTMYRKHSRVQLFVLLKSLKQFTFTRPAALMGNS